jgi:ankyrin repeat protein
MLTRYSAGAILGVCLLTGTVSAETDSKVDFGRDVLPLIRQNCMTCHGPNVQMNNFRLDRRSTAMRGGTRSVIVPGSSASSRLYLRLVGKEFGNQMPPTGALKPEQVAVIKAWIDQGAEWPDALANDVDLPPADATALRIVTALRTGDRAAFRQLVAEDPKFLNLRGPNGSTPFMFAVMYSDAAIVRELLEKGADPNHRNDANATALMWAADNLEKTRVLVAHGAEVNARSNDGRSPLAIAASKAGASPIVKFLLEHGANPNPAGPTDTVPIRQAAAAGDADVMQLLLDHGADPKAAGEEALVGSVETDCKKCIQLVEKSLDAKAYNAALVDLSVHSENFEAIKVAIEHGASVKATDVEGRTPLLFAANSDFLPLDTVQLLIDHGADVNARNMYGHTPLYLAKLHGNTPIVDLLLKSGAKPEEVVYPALKFQKANTIQRAVERAIPRLQQADVSFLQQSGCVSCHNEALTDMTLSTVRKAGFKVDEQMARQEVNGVAQFFELWRDRLYQGNAPGGVAYSLVGLHAEQYQPDLITDAIARYIALKQFTDGHWGYGCGGSRAPLCGAEISNTALSMRALQFYAPNAHRAEYERSIQMAGTWLVKTQAKTNEDRTYKVFGLAWAGKDKSALQKAMKELLATQRADGGWTDIATTNSTAYATGEAMVALHEAGLPVTDSAYRRGVQYLLSTQLEDGSWYIKTHSQAVQPYFDVGFPHGVDQWISASGTSWATMALALASPGPHPATTQVAATR